MKNPPLKETRWKCFYGNVSDRIKRDKIDRA